MKGYFVGALVFEGKTSLDDIRRDAAGFESNTRIEPKFFQEFIKSSEIGHGLIEYIEIYTIGPIYVGSGKLVYLKNVKPLPLWEKIR